MKPSLPAAMIISFGLALPAIAAAKGLHLSTPSFTQGGTIDQDQAFNQHGCTGRDISPAVSWSGAPKATQSFALTWFDTDARKGTGFWHWIVADIPPTTTHLAAGAGNENAPTLPTGAMQGTTTSNIHGYQGPCPPIGDAPHHYHLTLYALKIAHLPPAALASHAALKQALKHDAIATTSITGRYGRTKS